MAPAIYEICHMDSQDLIGPIFHLLVATTLFSDITDVAEVVVKLVLRSEPLHILTVCGKVL
jgi:hypothetical protein